MIEKIKNVNIKRICIVFILIQPILDIVTSILVRHINSIFTIGIFIRSIFMIFVAIYGILISAPKERKKILIYYGVLALYLVIFIATMCITNGKNMIFTQIKGAIKCFYLPIILVALFTIFTKKNIKINSNIYIYTLLIYCFSIFITKILGIAYPTYSIGLNVGTTGLFFAANEIGIILGILAVILFRELFMKKVENKRNFILYIVTLFLYIYSILEMGTKVPILAFLGMLCVTIIMCIVNAIKINKKIFMKKILGILGILIFIVLILPYTAVGININRNYGINTDLLSRIKINGKEIENKSNTEKNFNNKEEVTTAALSGRNLFLRNNMNEFTEGKGANKLFGIGYVDINSKGIVERKTVEIDYCDILFMQGIAGFILFWLPIAYIIFYIIKYTIKNIKYNILDVEIISKYIIIGLAFCVAMFAGHTLVAPAVSIYIALAVVKLYMDLKENCKLKL